MLNLFSYVLTCSKTCDRLPTFYKNWNDVRKEYAEKCGDLSPWLPLTQVWGMNSKRFERSPYWRVSDHPVNVPDKQTGNGLNRTGHTACYWGHVQMWRQALAEHDEDFESSAACFFEDDCVFDSDFWSRAFDAIAELPPDWDILYFGGQHCIHGRPRPDVYSENLYSVKNVNRLHAYAVKLSTLPRLILWFEENHDWGHNFHDTKTGKSEAEVDYAIGHLTEGGFLKGFALRRWACGQRPGLSATQGRFEQNGRWDI